MKNIRYVLQACLVLFSGLVYSAVNQDSFLERLDAYVRGDVVEIEISMTEAFRYVSHTSLRGGALLRIQLQPVDLQSTVSVNQQGQNRLRWTGTKNVPLLNVETEVSGNARVLLLHFKDKVTFKSVVSGGDNRSIIITMPLPEQLKSKVEIKKPVELPEVDQGIYVINLASSRKQSVIKEYKLTDVDSARHLYLAQSIVENNNWYRVRLGFFNSLKLARTYADQLKDRYPDAWVSEVTTHEQKLVLKGNTLVDMSRVKVKPVAGLNLPEISIQRLAGLMEEARNAMSTQKLGRAILVYNRVIAYPVQPYQRNALEFLGLARERKGQLAQAKNNYERYLKLYPEGDNAVRVKQRLAGLVTLSLKPRARLGRKEEVSEGESLWDVFGSFGQYYRRDLSKINNGSTDLNQSLLTNLLDVNARKRTDEYDIRMRLTGSYDYDLQDEQDSIFRSSSVYVDYASRDQEYLFRGGRQTRSTGGVLGRFDGVYFGKKLKDMYRLNFVTGLPVESTSHSLNKHKWFTGVSLDIGPVYDDWNFTLFGIQQMVDDETDRRAIGGEVRYFKEGRSVFGLLDYDIYFNELNILYVLGSWPLNDKTTINFIGDVRKSPLLTLSNALQGQTVTTIDSLKLTSPVSQIKQLAQDRAVTSKSATLGFSHTLHTNWQTTGDVTVTASSATPASGGVAATESTGPDYFLNFQLLGTNLFKHGDLVISGVRYSQTDSSDTLSFMVNTRYPIMKHWQVNPRIRLDLRENADGTDQWTAAPTLRTSYILNRKTTFELELGGEYTEQELLTGGVDETELFFLYAGYRHDF